MASWVVSACLIGNHCRYDGKDCLNQRVLDTLEGEAYLPICPECLGGLPSPRDPAEILRRIPTAIIQNRSGEDLTEPFLRGVEKALAMSLRFQANKAILKARSPSCGVGKVYDGAFSGLLVAGDGLFAERLRKHGFDLYTEEQV